MEYKWTQYKNQQFISDCIKSRHEKVIIRQHVKEFFLNFKLPNVMLPFFHFLTASDFWSDWTSENLFSVPLYIVIPLLVVSVVVNIIFGMQ